MWYLVADALLHTRERDVVKPAQANVHEEGKWMGRKKIQLAVED